MKPAIIVLFLLSAISAPAWSRQANSGAAASEPAPAAEKTVIPLTLSAGTPLQIELDQDVRIRSVGQAVHGKVIHDVYAFDKLVVPAGSEVTGSVESIDAVGSGKRTMAAMNGDFTPVHNIKIKFTDLALANGRHIVLNTEVTRGTSGVLQFVTPPQKHKENAAEKAASDQVNSTREQIKHDWETARAQVTQPGKMHRIERYAVAQLPVHPQYLDKGTPFDASLIAPLDFGTETFEPAALASIATPPPPDTVVHALLQTRLSSATAKKGDSLEATITDPVFAGGKLIFPAGSRISGVVTAAQPARRFHRNGQLRIEFRQIAPPSGLEQNIIANLEGVEVGGGEHLSLDEEGGAEVKTPKTRYLTTGIAVALAVTSARPDAEHGTIDATGDTQSNAAAGAFGFRLIGIVTSAAVHSRAFSAGMSAYGAGMALTTHFILRGREVVYAKYTPMVISLGSRDTAKPKLPGAAQPSNGTR
ncbi:MAG TPA: hypothetical protein VFO34_11920 [Candidatus Acidoferrales bacterium]|nr:hypothetical protein [Candidatus Acidoferrales bacterium]